MEINHQDDIFSLIARNLAGLHDSNENAQLEEWIESSADNKQYFEQIRNIWDASYKQIDLKKINTTKAFEKILDRIPKLSPKRSIWYYWQKVAAIIVLPLTITTLIWIYLNSNRRIFSDEFVYNEVYAAFGTRSALTLSDSTIVWLNSGSSLRYPNGFGNKNRKVYLKGEAYFEVKSDVSRPFIVQTSTLQVIATGTKFNIQDNNLNPLTEVTLVSGKISVNELGNDRDPRLISGLIPNQHLSYNKQTKQISINYEDVYKFIAWKDGKLVFRNESLDEVLNKISMIFNVDIEIHGEELKNYRFRATFEEESLEEILKLLKLSSPINFKEAKRDPLPDGSFPKKKVIIYPAKSTTQNKPI